jgi:hypothetical protein
MANVINATSTGNGGLVSTGDDSGILNIQTNETTAITVDASQNVGIGTASPTEKITVAGAVIATGGASSIARDAAIVDYSSGARFIAGRAGGNYGNWQALVAGASGITLRYKIDYDSTTQWFASDGTTERMRIDSSGNLLVNTTSQILSGKTCVAWNANSYNGIVLSETNNVSGTTFIIFAEGNTVCGGIYRVASTSAVTYTTTSDYRLKENVQPMTGALAKVARLKPVTYKWKEDGSEAQGFIAHELQEVVPDCVTGEKDAVDADGNPKYQGIDTSFLVATLTAAIQELKAINDTQAETINALTARIVALESK